MQPWEIEQIRLRNKYKNTLEELRSSDQNSVDEQIENLEDTLIRWIELGIQLYDIFVVADSIIQSPEKVTSSTDPYKKYKDTREFVLTNAVNNLAALGIHRSTDLRYQPDGTWTSIDPCTNIT